MKIRKSMIALGICVLAMILFVLIYPKHVPDISNAVVHEESGDIAYCVAERSGSFDVLRVTVVSRDGEERFTTTVFTGGGTYASMVWDGDVLCVYSGRTKETHAFDRLSGAISDYYISPEDIKNALSLNDWQHAFGTYYYTHDGYTYCYEAPTLFRHSSKLTIRHAEGDVVVFEAVKSSVRRES